MFFETWTLPEQTKTLFLRILQDLPPHSDNENDSKNQLLDSLLQPHFSQSLLQRERDFK